MDYMMGMALVLSLLWALGTFIIGQFSSIESIAKPFNIGIMICLIILAFGMSSAASTRIAVNAMLEVSHHQVIIPVDLDE